MGINHTKFWDQVEISERFNFPLFQLGGLASDEATKYLSVHNLGNVPTPHSSPSQSMTYSTDPVRLHTVSSVGLSLHGKFRHHQPWLTYGGRCFVGELLLPYTRPTSNLALLYEPPSEAINTVPRCLLRANESIGPQRRMGKI